MKASALILAAVLISLLAFPTPTRATWSSDFDPLFAELQSRASVLGSSTDKTEQTQFRAVTKSIAALTKAADALDDDLKTAGKVSGILQKAFADEFPAGNAAAASVTFSNSLGTIFSQLFDDLQGRVQVELDELARLANTMPEGGKRMAAESAHTSAQALFDTGANDYRTRSKNLLASLRATHAGEGIAFSVLSDSVITEFNGSDWRSGLTTGRYLGNSGSISVWGSTGSSSVIGIYLTVPANFRGVGVYPANGYLLQYEAAPYPPYVHRVRYDFSDGTFAINSFDLKGKDASGTFTFVCGAGTASNGTFCIGHMEIYLKGTAAANR